MTGEERRSPVLARAAAGALVAAWVAVLLCAWVYAVVLTHEASNLVMTTAVWGALLLASFAGFGSALGTWLFPRERADWGLRCAWGWGVAVAVGGLLCALGLARGRVLIGFTGLGLVLLVADVARASLRASHRRRWRRARLAGRDVPYTFGVAAALALGAIKASAMIANGLINRNDDDVAYFSFAREIVDRGTLSQPFSLRRVSAYGGKSLLDAFQLAVGTPESHLPFLDGGIALLAVLALVAGHPRSARGAPRALAFVTLLFALTLPSIRVNSTTLMTGVVFFLGLYRTLAWPPIARSRGWRAALPVALLAAGACTLRQSFLVPIAVLLAIAYGAPIVQSLGARGAGSRRAALSDAAITAALLLVFLAPWCALSQRWCGTFLFPAVNGNYNRAYSFFPTMSRSQWRDYVWRNFSYCEPVWALPLFLLAALASRETVARKPLPAIAIGAFVGIGALLYGYSHGTEIDQARYYFGFTCAAVFAAALSASDALASRRSRPWLQRVSPAALVALAMGAQLLRDRTETVLGFKVYLAQLAHPRNQTTPWPRDPDYVAVQRPVPPGEPLAVMVDHGARFDFARNRVEILDMVGSISPPPGIPLAAGPEAVAAYLLGLGYRYVVFVDPERAAELYRRDYWATRKPGWESLPVWTKSAHFYLEAFDDLDALARTRVHLAEAGAMTTLDLATRTDR